MDKTRLFQFLSTQDASFLLDLLSTAYDQMNNDQRQWVFGEFVEKLPPASVDGEVLLGKVEEFQPQIFTSTATERALANAWRSQEEDDRGR